LGNTKYSLVTLEIHGHFTGLQQQGHALGLFLIPRAAVNKEQQKAVAQRFTEF